MAYYKQKTISSVDTAFYYMIRTRDYPFSGEKSLFLGWHGRDALSDPLLGLGIEAAVLTVKSTQRLNKQITLLILVSLIFI